MGPLDILQTKLDALSPHGLVRGIDLLPKGHIRIETAFHYPDGSTMDLFIPRDDGFLGGLEPIEMTDFGNTLSWLAQLGMNPVKSRRRRKLMNDILRVYDISEHGTTLRCRVPIHELGAGIIRLGQACLRIADLAYTVRFLPRSQFAEEVEDMLDHAGFQYELGAPIAGSQGKVVKADFQVHGHRADTAMMLLSAETKIPATARTRAEHVFAVFFDLKAWPGQRVAALDDRSRIYEDADLNRIENVASILPFSDRDTLVEILKAA